MSDPTRAGTFGGELRRLRSEAGVSQQRIADAVGVKRATVAQWEADRFLPAQDKLDALDAHFATGGTLASLAEVARVAGAPSPPVLPSPAGMSFAVVLRGVADRLVAGMIEDPEDAGGTGWSQNIDGGGHPSPWSTAIGTRILLLADRVDVDLEKLARTLGKRQSARGWSNRRREVPRPEVTATVVATLSRIGAGGADLEDSWDWLGTTIKSGRDHSPFVLSTVLEQLAPLRPESDLVAEMVDFLLQARVDFGTVRAWVSDPMAEPDRVEPSMALTARAVVALRSAVAHTDRPDVRDAVDGAVQWLASQDNDDGVTESLRIKPDDRALDVVVNHFTSAHIVQALAGDETVRPERLHRALHTLWSSYVPADRLWAWKHDGRLPIWMNRDAVVAIRTAAFAGFLSPYPSPTGERVDHSDGGTSPPPPALDR